MKKIILSSLFVLITFITSASYVSAALPFNIPKQENEKLNPISTDTMFGGLQTSLGEIFAPMWGWGVIFITIVFASGNLVMLFSVLFKNGQWQKYGQTTMLFSFISMLLLRGLPIIILSLRNFSDVDVLLGYILSALSSGAIFLGVVSIAVSFLFQYGYQLIAHPEFHRWAKTLRSVAALMITFAIITPWVFPLI